MANAKQEFCRMAREMVNEELTGVGEYEKLHGYLEGWIQEGDTQPAEISLAAIQKRIELINSQELSHANFLAIVVAARCNDV